MKIVYRPMPGKTATTGGFDGVIVTKVRVGFDPGSGGFDGWED